MKKMFAMLAAVVSATMLMVGCGKGGAQQSAEAKAAVLSNAQGYLTASRSLIDTAIAEAKNVEGAKKDGIAKVEEFLKTVDIANAQVSSDMDINAGTPKFLFALELKKAVTAEEVFAALEKVDASAKFVKDEATGYYHVENDEEIYVAMAAENKLLLAGPKDCIAAGMKNIEAKAAAAIVDEATKDMGAQALYGVLNVTEDMKAQFGPQAKAMAQIDVPETVKVAENTEGKNHTVTVKAFFANDEAAKNACDKLNGFLAMGKTMGGEMAKALESIKMDAAGNVLTITATTDVNTIISLMK